MQKLKYFIIDFWSYAFKGGPKYYAWLGFLSIFILVGIYTSYIQFTQGLIVTGATDQATMEMFFANFVFTAHVAAAAILVVLPAFMYKHEGMKELAVLGEIIALGFVSTGILLVLYHMGRPDRFWHMVPGLGYFNFPNSTLDFDVIVLNVYLIVNLVAAYFLLYKRYVGKPVHGYFYRYLIWLAVLWGPLIHIITSAVLASNARMFAWNTAVLPFAFLSMAGASGPALIIIVFLLIRKYTRLQIADSAINLLSQIIIWSLGIMLLVFISEIFAVLYSGTEHADSLKFVMFGHNGLNDYVPWFWFIMACFAGSFFALLFPKVRKSYDRWLPIVCVVVAISILIEKPFLLIFPAFSPDPLGEYVVYHTTFIEYANVLACWAFGIMSMTLTLKAATGILVGDVSFSNRTAVSEQSPQS
ncbi:NrfD/PsrC family molybdoenzyme membrane anchor subunit [Ferrigenium sp. UT5]|uniref:NrfD/PsrC family molybdoenzyme membrane anchor subunit n=1 Tax=Ferrigenium sp. UT5 TaxID=3242105 RepID=UPI00354C55BD